MQVSNIPIEQATVCEVWARVVYRLVQIEFKRSTGQYESYGDIWLAVHEHLANAGFQALAAFAMRASFESSQGITTRRWRDYTIVRARQASMQRRFAVEQGSEHWPVYPPDSNRGVNFFVDNVDNLNPEA